MELQYIIIYIFLGMFVGLLSGLFGIGGGLVIVPILSYVFTILDFPSSIIMHMAIGTSLSIILVTVSFSSFHHYKRGGIDFEIYKNLFFFVIIGTLGGGFLSRFLSTKILEVIFAVYVLVVALKMFFDSSKTMKPKETSISLYAAVGVLIGLKSAILGIGGGTISIPFMSWRGVEMKKAVGISAALGIPVAIFGASSYIFNGIDKSKDILPLYSVGYVYLPAFFSVSLLSSFFSRFGVRLSYYFSQKKLQILFASFLVLVLLKSIYVIFMY